MGGKKNGKEEAGIALDPEKSVCQTTPANPPQGWQLSAQFGFCPKPNQTESFGVELN